MCPGWGDGSHHLSSRSPPGWWERHLDSDKTIVRKGRGWRGLEGDDEAAGVEFRNRAVPGAESMTGAEQEGAADLEGA